MVKILLLVPEYLPGFKAGGALRSTVNMIDRLGGEFDFKILTSDRDEGDQNSYKNVKIPMLGVVDSLNLSNAAAILIFEAIRQRNFK